MASLALGVAGAAIGSFFGPLGTSIGWSVGAALGGALFAKGQSGPRLSDLRVQGNSYGAPIPIGYGTIRIAGTVIWSTDLVEHKEKSGGKGGPKITTYTYTVSCAIQLLQTSAIGGAGTLVERPIVGILRVWADNRLIFGEGSPGDTLPMTIYYGDEGQLPDPTMEAEEGVGNVPAYRGTAYVVFTDWALAEFGNRIPNLTFEVVCNGKIGLEVYAEWPVDFSFPEDQSVYSYPYLLNGVDSSVSGQITMHRYRGGQDYVGVGFPGDFEYSYTSRTFDLFGNLLSSVAETNTAVPYNINGWDLYGTINNGIAYTSGQVQLVCNSVTIYVNTFQWLKDGVQTYTPPDLCSYADGATVNLGISSGPIYWADNVYAIAGGIGFPILRRWPAPGGECYTKDYDASFDLSDYTHDSAVAGGGDLNIGDDGYLYCRVSYFGGAGPDPSVLGGWGIKLLKFDADLNLIEARLNTELVGDVFGYTFGVPGFSSMVVYRGYYISHNNSGHYNLNPQYVLWRLNADHTMTFVDEIDPLPVSNGDSPPAFQYGTQLIYIGNGFAATRGGIIKLGGGGITLGEIVADVSDRCRYTTAQYNVSELTDVVKGYVLGSRMNGRAAIDVLRPVYQFGAVESNQTVKFRKWTGIIDAEIPDADLGARPAGDDPVELLETSHALEADLPRQIDAVYINIGMDYQDGHQLRQREVTSSELDVTVAMPVVLMDDEALRAAEVLLFNAWIERDRFHLQLPRKWSHLEPTDVISVRGRSMRLTDKTEVGYTHLEFDALGTVVNVFVNAPAAVAPIGFVPQPTPIPNHTDLLLLDIPLISDGDFTNGFYAAVAGRSASGWPGAAFMKSIDGGVNYTNIDNTSVAYGIGTATTVLGTFTGGNIFDETNSVTVRMTLGSPELVSSNTLGVLNGANMAVVGSEVFQFKTATLVAARTYTLSGLLRGRRGSDSFIGTHGYEERFALLPVHNLEG